ncbi:hypothetical protein HC251_25150 (plasmid) [Iamia sp. SCSIO 61187]|uniref:hypothetical protein n=1 Tax=Iamia sp. SCSIO 61187 TaxID=2722752 RepID=UPI001C6301F2|nr:hypothetical protein [Iamia sp. SCSIO 61187]QYG95840.1 hypothetical protein HC251_25150 [Iamia sp. SCSIO 61187]
MEREVDLPTSLTIRPADTYAAHGTDPGQPTTGYLRFWAPLLGPTTTLLYRMLLDATDDGRSYGYVDLGHLALDLGLGRGQGRHATITRTWVRMERYGLLFPVPDTWGHWQLPIHLPWLSDRQLNRLRPDLGHLERLYRTAVQDVTDLHRPQ